jgi:ABC-type amino acid transport substrate-binding protein
MAKTIRDNTKKTRGRPKTTGTGTLIGVRVLDPLLEAIDRWIEKQKEDGLSRPEAIRRLLELGLRRK